MPESAIENECDRGGPAATVQMSLCQGPTDTDRTSSQAKVELVPHTTKNKESEVFLFFFNFKEVKLKLDFISVLYCTQLH